MIMVLFLKGILIGIIFGVPAGALGALTIQRTLEKGFAAGFITGLGSSLADVIYSCVGVFGIAIISDFFDMHKAIIQIAGGILIIILSITTLRKKQLPVLQQDSKGTPAFCFFSAFTAAMLNPAMIVSFMVAFSAFGISGDLSGCQAVVLISGILAGTICWWLTISGVVSCFRSKITNNIYKWLNRILGSIMALFGLFIIFQGIRNI